MRYKPKGWHKFGAKPMIVNGIKFQSRREGRRYQNLLLQEKAGYIFRLKRQIKFELQPAFKYKGKVKRSISYFADFEYIKNGKLIHEDSKGFRTPEYKIKKKLLLFKYPDINFIET